MSEIYYKVRRKSTGEYYCGGVDGKWNRSGKIWTCLGHLRRMITINMPNAYGFRGADFSDWEIIEYEVTEKAVKGVHEVIKSDKLVQLL